MNKQEIELTMEAMREALAPDQSPDNYSIERQWDINDIREALKDPAIVRTLAAILVEQQRLDHTFTMSAPPVFEDLEGLPPGTVLKVAAGALWFIATKETARSE